jgi:hypothetical protein
VSWAAEEFGGIGLGDERLNKRAVRLVERLAASPTASIPTACGGWAETQAAYRFLAQEDLGWESILEPHWTRTLERMGQHSRVLCIQDTTELNFNGQTIEGLGPLSFEAQRGMYLHPTYAVTLDREPLGVLDAYMWTREFKDDNGRRAGLKESTRWIEGYERLAELSPKLADTRLTYVADREADILELMKKAQALGEPVDWLIRSQHNRALPEGERLWAQAMAGEAVGEVRFHLGARPGRKAREVRQRLWVRRMEIGDKHGGTVSVTALVAQEVAPPAGQKALEWRLLSNLEVADFEAAAELIRWYRARWEIEMFFNILKTGCRVEALQLASVERVERALSLFVVIAWRINRLMRLGRACPELPAEVIFDRDEWHAAYILNKKKPPAEPPQLNTVLRLVATLGGFLGRKGDGEPGAKAIWQGLQRVMDGAATLQFTRELQAGG